MSEEHEEQQQDEIQRKPASENRWYKLATVAGEIEGGQAKILGRKFNTVPGKTEANWSSRDDETAQKNCYYWNGWLRQCLEEHNSQKSDAKLPWPTNADGHEIELPKLNDVERTKIFQIFGKDPIPNSATDTIDFRNVTFPKVDFTDFVFYWTNFKGAQFKDEADFKGAKFKRVAEFTSVLFKDEASFRGAQFEELTSFEKAQFKDRADFVGAQFEELTSFKEAQFAKSANFRKTQFKNGANFARVQFAGGMSFEEAQFREKIDFSSTKFQAETNFKATNFTNEPPLFYAASLHENTNFRGINLPDPPRDPDKADDQSSTYNCLVLMMRNHNRYAEEMRFFALEMRAKRKADGRCFNSLMNGLYSLFCGYGYNAGRAFLFWLGQWFIFGVCITVNLRLTPELSQGFDNSWWLCIQRAAGLSASYSLPIFGFSRPWITKNYDYLDSGYLVLAGSQSVISTIMLFLLVLCLRNYFRIK